MVVSNSKKSERQYESLTRLYPAPILTKRDFVTTFIKDKHLLFCNKKAFCSQSAAVFSHHFHDREVSMIHHPTNLSFRPVKSLFDIFMPRIQVKCNSLLISSNSAIFSLQKKILKKLQLHLNQRRPYSCQPQIFNSSI